MSDSLMAEGSSAIAATWEGTNPGVALTQGEGLLAIHATAEAWR